MWMCGIIMTVHQIRLVSKANRFHVFGRNGFHGRFSQPLANSKIQGNMYAVCLYVRVRFSGTKQPVESLTFVLMFRCYLIIFGSSPFCAPRFHLVLVYLNSHSDLLVCLYYLHTI